MIGAHEGVEIVTRFAEPDPGIRLAPNARDKNRSTIRDNR